MRSEVEKALGSPAEKSDTGREDRSKKEEKMETHTILIILGFIACCLVFAALLFMPVCANRAEERQEGGSSATWDDDIITDPVFSFMSCNIYHSDE